MELIATSGYVTQTRPFTQNSWSWRTKLRPGLAVFFSPVGTTEWRKATAKKQSFSHINLPPKYWSIIILVQSRSRYWSSVIPPSSFGQWSECLLHSIAMFRCSTVGTTTFWSRGHVSAIGQNRLSCKLIAMVGSFWYFHKVYVLWAVLLFAQCTG